MLKNRKCSVVGINNYNKFLSTLDQSISNKKKCNTPIVQESCENTIIDMEQEMKNIIDKIIENFPWAGCQNYRLQSLDQFGPDLVM
jgi:hypothetical protein